jgi:3-dehydroquinate dehydratase-2
MKINIINGPNLNLLGKRENEIYGDLTLESIKTYTNELSPKNFEIDWFQSNLEGSIVEEIQRSILNYDAIVINPAGYSHTSVAIYDALKCFPGLIVEVHLSNVYQREEFRQTMLTAKAASTIMTGLGKNAYLTALQYLQLALKDKE